MIPIFGSAMKFFIFFWLLPLFLQGFEPHVVTPYPVLGLREMSLGENSDTKNSTFSVWYPVDAAEIGATSPNPWDVFKIAVNAAPAAPKAKKPLIVISHGYTGNPHQLSWLIRGLVQHGFIVIGMQHSDQIEGKVHINHWKRPRDISQMIDRFSEAAFANFANLKNIGISGYSLGGTTALWIAGGRTTKLDSLIPGAEFASKEDYILADQALPTLDKTMMAKDWHDPRVTAAFVMAPAWAWLFDEKSLQGITIPTYLIAAAADQTLVTLNNAGFFARNIPKSTFQAIPGKAGHYIFLSVLDKNERRKADPDDELSFLFEDDVSIDRRWIQQQVVEEAVGFFRSVFDQTAK